MTKILIDKETAKHLLADLEEQVEMANGWKSPAEAKAITVLSQALKQSTEQEPVTCPYCHNSHTLGAVYFDQNCAECVKRMATPPQPQESAPRQWVGLTDEQWETTHWSPDFRAGAKWAEAKLKEKNI